MERWHMRPKRFTGEIELAGRRAAVKFTVAVSRSGVAKLTLDRMLLEKANAFIVEAVYDQQKAQRYFDFSLIGKARDGTAFYSETVNINSSGMSFSDTASSTIRPASWCLECRIVSAKAVEDKPGMRNLLRGFDSIHALSARCLLGALELRSPMRLESSDKKLLTGLLTIDAPALDIDFEDWRKEAENLLKHVRSVMSFARGERVAAPITEIIWNGKKEVLVRMTSSQDGHGSGAFTTFDYRPIFQQAVASHFFEPGRKKDIAVAIEWFTMPAGYREAKLTSAMTVLENLLTKNLQESDLALRPNKQFEKLRDELLATARRCLLDLGSSMEKIDEEVAMLRPKLNDLNRRTLKEKIHLLGERWGVPLDDISDEALGKAKQARDHIVHRGQYIPKSSSEDLMGHVRLARELVIRFVLAALEFDGAYTSAVTGEHGQQFKLLRSRIG